MRQGFTLALYFHKFEESWAGPENEATIRWVLKERESCQEFSNL